MQKLQQGNSTVLGLVYLVIVLACVGGWLANIVKIIGMDAITSGMGIVRIAGIFVPPVGALMGYF